MPGPPRRRVDFTQLPTIARYALALTVLAVVVGVVVVVRGDDASDEPAGWYTVVVRVGAILLLVYAGFWLIRRVKRSRQRH
jgi:ABC-type nickel/cobalt efflux system permease component RcnA